MKQKKAKNKIKNKRRIAYIKKYQKQIHKNRDCVWCPPLDIKYKKIRNHKTWFDIEVGKSKNKNNFNLKNKFDFPKEYIKCKKVELNLNKEQILIINKWFASYALMYNCTLKLIKERRIKGKKTILDFKKLRTRYLKKQKRSIIKFYDDNKKEVVKSHNLDYAIKLACANYKSALTNYKNGNIKSFRIRYWRHNKNIKVMDIENQYFKEAGLCPKLFEDINATYNGNPFKLTNINITCKMTFERDNNKYYLFIPERCETKRIYGKQKIISCDPGIRTFMTGISENNVVKIGDNCSEKIKKRLKLIDKRNKMNISNKIKKKNEKINNKKIVGLVNELHWKTINYLTKNYKKVLVGDLSVKGITNKKTSNINKMTKRIAYKLSFFNFRERLKYKCLARKTQYELIDESYTSKICSMCGYLKENLGSAKIYKCDSCKKHIDRDVNGARCILIKSL